MVLSNKKRKQMLRAAKAEVIVVSDGHNNLNGIGKGPEIVGNLDSKKLHSVGILTSPLSQKPNISKREKQRPQIDNPEIPKSEEISGSAKGKKEDGQKPDDTETKNMKKRKRGESKGSENMKEKNIERIKKKMKKKKKKEAKKKRRLNKARNALMKEKGEEQNGSAPSGEQFMAKPDEIVVRREDTEVSEKVYVGGIPYYSTEDDIRSYFEHCGTITDVDCMKFPDTGKFRGIAVISFKTEAAAKRALALDGSDMGGLFLKIQPFKSAKANKTPNFTPSILEGYNRIYIGNLSWDITEEDLRKLFSDCTISSIRFGEDKETRDFKGYAHVDFADSISFNVALKLDQSIVCGRPVRITCAVPKNGAVNNLKSIPKDNPIETDKVTSQPNTPIGSVKVITVNEDQDNNSVSMTDAMSSKIRRRSCYVCGEKGHLSSSCPKTVDLKNPIAAVSEDLNFTPEDNYVSSSEVKAVNTNATNGISSKIRRRSCYVCGEKGHLSSSCPKNQSADSKNPIVAVSEDLNLMPEDNYVSSFEVSALNVENVNSNAINGTSSKIRRRSCYVCGEKGHLSSSCPKNQAAESKNPVAAVVSEVTIYTPDYTQVSGVEINQVSQEKVNSNSSQNTTSSKIRRRTCYECGEKGHLSSSCPKVQSANLITT